MGLEDVLPDPGILLASAFTQISIEKIIKITDYFDGISRICENAGLGIWGIFAGIAIIATIVTVIKTRNIIKSLLTLVAVPVIVMSCSDFGYLALMCARFEYSEHIGKEEMDYSRYGFLGVSLLTVVSALIIFLVRRGRESVKEVAAS